MKRARRTWLMSRFRWLTLAFAALVGVAYPLSAAGFAFISPVGWVVGLSAGWVYIDRAALTEPWGCYLSGVAASGHLMSISCPDGHVVNLSMARVIPLWPLAAIAALLVVAAWWRRIVPVPAGHCPTCWYDLRGVPVVDGVVKCPECGHGMAVA